MTIGIAASGPGAGLAVFRALAAVERVAQGAIGGYAVFAAIDAAGNLHRAETQRGGTTTLFTDGETTGVAPPPAVAEATIAGLMSSGPDRPEPLEQYVPARAGVGLVTGHRLPNAPGRNGRPLNLEVLERLAAGDDARAAVEAVLAADPGADAGMIAVDAAGRVYGANSARVARRPDLGHARRTDPGGRAVVEVLHNAIHPAAAIAELAACIALDTMFPPLRADGHITVIAGTPLASADTDRIHVDADGVARRIDTTDRRILSGHHNCAPIQLGTEIHHDATLIGHTVFEPNCVVDNAEIVTLNNQQSLHITYRTPNPKPNPP